MSAWTCITFVTDREEQLEDVLQSLFNTALQSSPLIYVEDGRVTLYRSGWGPVLDDMLGDGQVQAAITDMVQELGEHGLYAWCFIHTGNDTGHNGKFRIYRARELDVLDDDRDTVHEVEEREAVYYGTDMSGRSVQEAMEEIADRTGEKPYCKVWYGVPAYSFSHAKEKAEVEA